MTWTDEDERTAQAIAEDAIYGEHGYEGDTEAIVRHAICAAVELERAQAAERQEVHDASHRADVRCLQAQIDNLTAAGPAPRCSRCGCVATDHAVDGEERRGCDACECTQYETP